jgi:hypothetical protein
MGEKSFREKFMGFWGEGNEVRVSRRCLVVLFVVLIDSFYRIFSLQFYVSIVILL